MKRRTNIKITFSWIIIFILLLSYIVPSTNAVLAEMFDDESSPPEVSVVQNIDAQLDVSEEAIIAAAVSEESVLPVNTDVEPDLDEIIPIIVPSIAPDVPLEEEFEPVVTPDVIPVEESEPETTQIEVFEQEPEAEITEAIIVEEESEAEITQDEIPAKEFEPEITLDEVTEIQPFNIITPVPDTHTYTFYHEGIEVASQIVKDGETLLRPNTPAKEDYRFLGWYDAAYADKLIEFGPISVAGMKTIDAEARFAPVLFVYFIQDGYRLATKEAVSGEAVDPTGVSFTLPENKCFSHWSTTKGGAPFDFSQPIVENTSLYLVAKNKIKVTFNTEGTSVLPLFFEAGQSIAGQGHDPTSAKKGYDFDGWLLDDQPYDLSTPITGSIVLTAKFSPGNNTPYRVVYWFENPDDENYSVAGYYNTTGTTDAVAGFNTPSYGFHYGVDFTHFTYNEGKSDTDTLISEDGSTIVNVYYNRKTFTLHFSGDVNIFGLGSG